MLINIQLLRFIAAILVLLYHTSFRLPAGDGMAHGLFYLGHVSGFAGVDIFFVISGFIMAYTTLDETGSGDGFRFLRRRLARIYSGYWPFFLLALAVFSWTRPDQVGASDLGKSFLLWPQPLNRTLLAVTWTLSFELYFYLLFTLLILWVPRQHRSGLCAWVAGGMLALAMYRHFIGASFAPGELEHMPFAEHFLISPYLIEFFAGSVLAYWLVSRPHGPALSWLIAGCLLYLVSGWVNEAWFDGKIEQGYYVVPRVLWFGSASVLIVAGLVRLEHRGRRAPESFSIRSGGASYALYLCHVPLLTLATRLGMPGALADRPFGWVSLAYILLMAGISAFSIWYYGRIERRLHRLFRRGLAV